MSQIDKLIAFDDWLTQRIYEQRQAKEAAIRMDEPLSKITSIGGHIKALVQSRDYLRSHFPFVIEGSTNEQGS